jgi:hypothetical protein
MVDPSEWKAFADTHSEFLKRFDNLHTLVKS